MTTIISVFALLSTALLFGGMVLFSFGFAVFALAALPADAARSLIRRAFPPYYLAVIACAAVAGGLVAMRDPVGAGLLAAIALTTVPARQLLMPAINSATDTGNKRQFGRLHGLSVVIQLVQIAAAGVVLARFL
jgi:hypothetical protein